MLEKASKWLNELGISSHFHEATMLSVSREEMIAFGSPDEILSELKMAFGYSRFCWMDKNADVLTLTII